MIYSTVNHQELPFSDPTHPPLWWRNIWMVPYQVNWQLVTGNGSLTPICSLSKRSLSPSLTLFKCTHWRWMVIYSMNLMMIWLVQYVKYHTNQSSVFERSVFYLVRRPNLLNDNHKRLIRAAIFLRLLCRNFLLDKKTYIESVWNKV